MTGSSDLCVLERHRFSSTPSAYWKSEMRPFLVEQHAATQRYALSFTSGALLIREATIVAPLFLRSTDLHKVQTTIAAENILQARTVSSGSRLAREVTQRLAVLTGEEIELLIKATSTERGHLLWAAVCRRYSLVGEFAEEVVRERFLLLTPALTHEDFDSFVRGKSLWHTELAELKDSTRRKLRSNLFRMLNEAGLISGGRIQQAVMSQRVVNALAGTPNNLRFFPTTNDGRAR